MRFVKKRGKVTERMGKESSSNGEIFARKGWLKGWLIVFLSKGGLARSSKRKSLRGSGSERGRVGFFRFVEEDVCGQVRC